MATGYYNYNYADEITPKQTININDMGTFINNVIRERDANITVTFKSLPYRRVESQKIFIE